MLSRLPPRVLGLAIGAGASAGGLVMALLGVGLGEDYLGLVAAGLVIAAFGLVLAVVGAIGFALHGPVRPRRE
ncbi:hypothetical protein DEJ23_14300 [Curtobacterium sp. MCSS17_008]|nr:hypothetical protein DEJ23_14300 [Curtobacterium sp. MCSS17_008]